ncbi:MAG: glycosyltransferase family 4 protein [Candidatus Aminicenantes bacterium]|nr:MAG: glycosyltransferase family 4 protein [Candidatus Aminicenantes bacterium]
MPAFYLEPNDIKGGSETQAYLIAQELLKRGWEVHYIRENNQQLGQQEKINEIVVHSLTERHTKLKWLNTRQLSCLMEEIRADVWYCRATVSYVFPVWLNARKIGGKVLWSCSSDRFLSKRLIKEMKKESFLRKIASYIDRFLFLKTIRKIDLVILQSQRQKKMLKENWKLKGEVIYNSQPVVPLKNWERKPLILWIGRLMFRKHPERYLEVVKRLKGRPYEFLALGKESEELGFLEEFAKTENEVPNFRYLGEIEREKLFGLLERAKLIINTSDYEGFSNTFIEAWMHGVPVVSLKADPDDLIKTCELGRVSTEMEKLIKDVEELMEDEYSWKIISERVKKFSRERFDIKKSVDSLIYHINNIH